MRWPRFLCALLNFFFFLFVCSFNEAKTSYHCKGLLDRFIDVLTCNVVCREEKLHIAGRCERYCGLPCSTAVAVQAQKCQVYASSLLGL